MKDEAAKGQQITPHLNMGEEFYIKDKDADGKEFKKKYRIVPSGGVDSRAYNAIAALKVI